MNLISVKIADQTFTQIVAMQVERDLQEIAGTFELTIVDEARLKACLPNAIGIPTTNAPVKAGQPITIMVDAEPILVGWIERPRLIWKSGQIGMVVRGRDKTGDLVECAALPTGPTEFHGLDLLAVANKVCSPFGIPVKKDVDIGAPFERLSKFKHQTALTFLESASRQRSVLLTSDGVGGLVLTRGGSTRAPSDLVIGDNIQEVDAEFDWTHRFSHYYVTQDSAKVRTGSPALDSTVVPLGSTTVSSTPGNASAAEAPSIGAVGLAIDPEVTRYRPTVRLTRSQSGMSTVQEQAEWMARVSKGQSEQIKLTALEYRTGPKNTLWRPNQVANVSEPYSGLNKDMLIAGVRFVLDEQGRRTIMRICGVTAYDRINEADRHRGHKQQTGKQALDSTPRQIQVP
jgi:prophage tail gpP-like protein